MPITEFFIQRKDKSWEEVDEFIFKNWKNALDENENPRYNGNRLVRVDSKVQFYQETELTGRDFVHIAKLSGASHNDLTSTVPGGFCKKPEFVMIVKGNSNLLRKNGFKTFRATLTKKPTQSLFDNPEKILEKV